MNYLTRRQRAWQWTKVALTLPGIAGAVYAIRHSRQGAPIGVFEVILLVVMGVASLIVLYPKKFRYNLIITPEYCRAASSVAFSLSVVYICILGIGLYFGH